MPIPRSTAELFRPLALCVKLALLPFVSGPAFQQAAPNEDVFAGPVVAEAEALASRVAVLEQLLDVVEPTIMDQSSQLELALAESQNLLESAADAILIADGDGRIVRLNQQAERMFGYTRKALVGQPVEMLIPEPKRARHMLLRKAYVAQPPPATALVNLEIRARHESGATIPAELTLSPVETAQRLLLIVDPPGHHRAKTRRGAPETAEPASRGDRAFRACGS